MTARRTLCAIGPDGAFVVTGQTAKALDALMAAGRLGITALEVDSWAYRLGAYVHVLRHRHGLAIELRKEPHEGGWHGRYVLHSAVTVADCSPDDEGGKQAAEPQRRAA